MTKIRTAVLATLAAARITRLVVDDDIGEWWVKQPIDAAMDRYAADPANAAKGEPWWWKYRSGLDCPWCVGFWASAAAVAAFAATRNTPRARAVVEAGAAAFAVSHAVGVAATAVNTAAAHADAAHAVTEWLSTATDDDDEQDGND